MAIFNMVGGGGGLSENNAVLLVTVLTGSSVTATKNGTTLTPKLWTQSADNTLDTAIFSIPSSTFDQTAWTVTATINGDTASDTIVINSAQEYNMKLACPIYFVKNGVIDTALTSEMTGGSITQKSGYVRFATGPSAVAFFDASVNSNFSTIVLEVVNSGNESWHGNQCPAIGYSASKPAANNSNGAVSPYTAYTNLNNVEGTIQAKTYTVAANATGTNWVWLCLSGTNNRSCHVDVYNFYIT